jgi:hypothetical protein
VFHVDFGIRFFILKFKHAVNCIWRFPHQCVGASNRLI